VSTSQSSRADAALSTLNALGAPGKAIAVPVDLMSFDSLRAAGKKLRADFSANGIDVLCNNAGVMAVKDEATVDGCDVQMQTNHLSHFLLTAEVWPLLERAAEKNGEARVVNHSSDARKQGIASVRVVNFVLKMVLQLCNNDFIERRKLRGGEVPGPQWWESRW